MITNIITAQVPPIEAGVSQKLAQWRSANYSDVRYKLNITLEKGAPLMKGEIEIRVKLTEEGAKSPLVLDWRTTQFQNDKDKPFANVVSVNGTTGAQASSLANTAFFSGVKTSADNKLESNSDAFSLRSLQAGTLALQSNEHLIIPKELLKTGENVIKIEFASPIKTSGSAVTRYVDKEDGAEYVYSLFVPSDASTAFPVFDQPDLKARFQLAIDAPKGWKVISNTSSDGLIYGSQSRNEFGFKFLNDGYIFDETQPISTYVFAFAAGEFKEFSKRYSQADTSKKLELPINATVSYHPPRPTLWSIYVRKSQAEKFKAHEEEIFRLNREAVKYLENYFDYKFPFPKYDLVLIPEFPFGGMEHAGATFLRESSIIFPNEPTKNDYVSRANLIFHEAAHQWFGDTVTMRWFDDLWLKEGFAEFMAYKTLEKVMPEMNAWKIFYERNKQLAYLTDSTRGTTPIYQEITNLSSAKSAYGNIVYRKAPSFLKQAEFYLGADNFQKAVRAFLKKHEFKNATWTDLVKEFANSAGKEFKEKSGVEVQEWAQTWVKQRGMPIVFVKEGDLRMYRTREDIEKNGGGMHDTAELYWLEQTDAIGENKIWNENVNVLMRYPDGKNQIENVTIHQAKNYQFATFWVISGGKSNNNIQTPIFVFPNYQDYGYGIFLLDEKSRAYVLENIQTEKDDFLRSMMWGALWDSVRETELNPKDYVELVIKNINIETDESTINTLLNRVGTAMNYYIDEGRNTTVRECVNCSTENTLANARVSASKDELASRLETLLIEKMQKSETLGQRITFYRAFLNNASSEKARNVLKEMLKGGNPSVSAGANNVKENTPLLTRGFLPLKTKDKFDIVTRLIILGDKDALALIAELEKTETSDDAKRYAYAVRAGIATGENKLKYWNDFVSNKELSESWIESAFAVFNSPRHSDLTLPYLEKALAELPNLKRNRKIFFVNGWLSAFIGGQRSEEALKIVNKFLADNPNLDKDLRLKILENVDLIERAVKIRKKFEK